MQVKKRMVRKLVTISSDTSILKAMEVMRKNSIRHLPVVDEEDFVGFVTEGDLRQASLLSMVEQVSIKEVMIKDPVTVSPDASLEKAAKLIISHKIGGLPVVHGKKLVGIITIIDILSAFVQMMGILRASSRLDVVLGGKPHAFEEISAVFRKHRAEIISVGMSSHKDRKRRIYYFRLGKCRLQPIVASLKGKGYRVLSIAE